MDDIYSDRRKRLRQFINSLIITDKRFADSLGKKPAVLSQLLNGYRKISADFAYEVSKIYKSLNPEWLISGIGEMNRSKDLGEAYQIEIGEPRSFEDLEAIYRADPLAGLRDLISRVEALERDIAELKEGKEGR